MNDEKIVDPDSCYPNAERKAARYFAALTGQAQSQQYASILTGQLRLWQRQHVGRMPWLSALSRVTGNAAGGNYQRHIQWLNHSGKLDDYLNRSVSYIYMRDLGKALEQPATQARIQAVAADVKQRLLQSGESGKGDGLDFISLAGLYRWAQQESVESAVIWAIDKLKGVASHIPEQMNAEHAQRKLIKIIIGVVLHAIEEMDSGTAPAERAKRIDEAIRLGYSYGLTYPFIDDLLDAPVLSEQEKASYSQLIRTALLTGRVPVLGEEWSGANQSMIGFIHAELKEGFEYVQRYQSPETQQLFFEQTYVFFQSQELDRAKRLTNPSYTNEELYLPIILKSASSRLIARSVLNAPEDESFEDRTFYYGIYNQLADDFADLFDDREAGAVTPYTYYLTYRDRRTDLINPFELYWTVISFLIHDVYRQSEQAREVILSRAINGLKRCKERLGEAKYGELMETFACGSPSFNRLVQQMVQKADDVEFLDKLLRDHLVTFLRTERKEKTEFRATVQEAREQINRALKVAKRDDALPIKETLIDAANYSLEGDAKRLRPILSWVMGVQEYGLEASAIMPLLKSLEYMHTASLIFDDLPSQDNSDMRRGRPTLHVTSDSATAELAGLLLIQKAVQEQASLHSFDAKAVLTLIKYSAEKAEDLCMGQAMDLEAKGKPLTPSQLDTICYYKTGIAFEAALVMPAILAQASEREIAALKTFAYHAGIAFQIKDDLLDLEGEASVIGKPVGLDRANHTSSFVTVLGKQEAQKAMWNHYCLACDALLALQRQPAFLKHLLDFIVNRDR